MKIFNKNVLVKSLLFSFLLTAILSVVSCEKKEVDPEDEPPVVNDDKWETELVDSIAGVDVGIYNMLAFDVDSGIHIAYVVSEDNYSLKYAYKPYGGNWTVSEVANPISDNIIDIAVDKQKNVFIAYRGYETGSDVNERMYIAEKSINGTFNKVQVDVLGDHNHQARYPAIYADNNDIIHLSFERANYGMRYTSYSFGGTFTLVETLDDDASSSCSDIVIDSEGNKHIIHFNGDDVYHSYCANSENTWLVTQITTGDISAASYEGISLAVDQFDNLHASYRYGSTSADNNIHYLYKPAGSSTWQEDGIENAGGSSRHDRAIACDTLGNPHVLYDESFGLKIASKNISWSHEAIFGNSDNRADTNYDIEITDKNRAHVSFYVRSTGVLRYATKRLE